MSKRKSVAFPDIQFKDPQLAAFAQGVRAALNELQQTQAFLRGGPTKAALTKVSAADYDITWSTDVVTPGSVWRAGVGPPAASLGVDGDFYLNEVTGDVYEKEAGAYVFIATFKGAKGDKGDKGDKGGVGPAGVGLPGAPGRRGWDGEDGTAGKVMQQVLGSTADSSPAYRIQADTPHFWRTLDFVRGITIIGVRVVGPAQVFLPHALPIDQVIAVKDELGSGAITVKVY